MQMVASHSGIVTCVPTEDSDQPAHPWVVKHPTFLQAEILTSDHTGNVTEADSNLSCTHMPTCTFSWIVAHLYTLFWVHILMFIGKHIVYVRSRAGLSVRLHRSLS